MRVILVEDEKRAMRGLRSLLESLMQGIEIVGEAADGAIAFEMIKNLSPDVVFTDIRMQYMDGLALIRAVRDYGYDTKFVIISAYEDFDYARAVIPLNVVEYLVKPITAQEMQRVLDRLAEEMAERKETGETRHSAAKRLSEQYPQAHPVVGKALDLIEKNYASKISQKEIAERLGVSAEYFSYLFSRDIQENFSRFIRKFRIEKVKELLEKGEQNAEVLARETGFSDIKYFYKCFKEETGMNLTEYRKKTGQNARNEST